MVNGVYVAELKLYPGSKRRVNVFQGKASIYTLGGEFVCNVNTDVLQSEYMNFQKPPKPLYNLAWMIHGEIKEYIMQNVSYALCKHKIKELMNDPRYKPGLLMPVQSQLS